MADHILPKQVTPIEWANRGATVEGNIPLSELPRLAGVIADQTGKLQVSLRFDKDIVGIRYIKGMINAEFAVLCQRCLQPFSYTLEIPVSLSPVTNEAAAKRLPESYEPLFVTADEPILLANIIEEELLLSLPLVTKHEVCP